MAKNTRRRTSVRNAAQHRNRRASTTKATPSVGAKVSPQPLDDGPTRAVKASTRRSRHRQEVHDRILAAAYELASERDFDKIMVHDITDLADVGRGTLFNYFGHKDT